MTDRITQIEALLSESPTDAFLLHAMSLEYKKLENFEKSKYFFDKNLELNPDYLGAYYAYGKLLEAHHYPEEALEIYEKGKVLAQAQNDIKTYNEIQAAIDWMD